MTWFFVSVAVLPAGSSTSTTPVGSGASQNQQPTGFSISRNEPRFERVADRLQIAGQRDQLAVEFAQMLGNVGREWRSSVVAVKTAHGSGLTPSARIGGSRDGSNRRANGRGEWNDDGNMPGVIRPFAASSAAARYSQPVSSKLGIAHSEFGHAAVEDGGGRRARRHERAPVRRAATAIGRRPATTGQVVARARPRRPAVCRRTGRRDFCVPFGCAAAERDQFELQFLGFPEFRRGQFDCLPQRRGRLVEFAL